MQTSIELIVYGDYVVTMDSARPVIQHGAVAIDQGRIVTVGSSSDVNKHYSSQTSIPGTNKVLLPGLVNGHTHAAMSLFRGYADDEVLMEWLNQHIGPLEQAIVSEEMVDVGTKLACWEMLCNGTTTFCDMYFYYERTEEVVDAIGMRAYIAATMADVPRNDAKNMEDQWDRAENFLSSPKSSTTTVSHILGGHAIYTLSRSQLIQLSRLAKTFNVPIHIHLSETEYEVEYSREQHEKTPIQFLDSLDFFDNQVIAAHVVWPQLDEYDILVKKSVGVIHNPSSNAKLASGIAPVAELLNRGVCVGLGTDSVASNNDLDMWEEMRLAAFMQKLITRDPTALPARVVLSMATKNSATALARTPNFGALKEGNCADLIQVQINNAHQLPMYDVESQLVYATHGSDVCTTIVNGKILLDERQPTTIDIAALRHDVGKITKKIRDFRQSRP